MKCPACGTPIHATTDADGFVSRGARWTSKVASRVQRGTQRARVLAAIVESGHGLTDDEIGARLGISGNSVRPRRLELVDLGLVEDTGNVRAMGPNGNPCTIWAATLLGFGEAGRIRGENA